MISNNRFDLATLCHDSCEGNCKSIRATHKVAARIAPLNALQVKRMLDIRAYARAIKERYRKINQLRQDSGRIKRKYITTEYK
jgi:hypothetical protein